MDNWIFLLIFIFTILICSRNVFLFVASFLPTEPEKYTLTPKELMLLGVSVSYFITYLIY